MGSRDVLNMGAGVQTTALLIKYVDIFDSVVFADTGDEMPETYDYINDYIKPLAGKRWHTVRATRAASLYDHCIERKIVPIIARRWCTEDFKVKPLQRFYRKYYHATHKNPVYIHIGFSLDEAHRANFSRKMPRYTIAKYPLLDDHITREQCKEIIKSHGWPLPVKSGCYYCPFQSKKKWRELRANHPDLFILSEKLEQNDRFYPKRTLSRAGKLRVITGADLHSLDDYDHTEDLCDSGHCML